MNEMHIDYYRSSVESLDRVCIKIADITISLISTDPDLKLWVDKVTENFLLDEVESDVRVRVAWKDLSKKIWGRRIFDSGSHWQLYQENGSYLFRFAWPRCGNVPNKVACFDLEFTSGEINLHRPFFESDQPVYPLEYPLDELLITNLLARGTGAEIHSCGIIDRSGNGLLFAGQSEAGKTTIARLWQKHQGITVLSDDRIILRKLDGTIWIYGTPWHGDARIACPARAPLTRIYFLEKGQKNKLVLTKPTSAAARLFACSFPPFYSREGLDFTLGFLGEVTNSIPCHELRFVPTEEVIDFIGERSA